MPMTEFLGDSSGNPIPPSVNASSSVDGKKRKSETLMDANLKLRGVVVDGSNGEAVNAISTQRDFSQDRWTAASNRRFNGLGKSEGENIWQGPFFFAQLADTQLGAIEQNVTDEPEIELATKAIQTLNILQPKYAIICGDLVNHVPEMYPKEDPNIRNTQVANFKRIMEDLDCKIPLVCVCGNHDVDNSPTSITINRYKNEFGDDYFSFWTGGVCNIVLNSNTYYDPQNCEEYHITQHTWLETELKSAREANAQHIMVFCHHPLWLVNPNESEDSEEIGFLEFTVKSGAVIKIPNTYFHISKERRLALLTLMKQYNARYVFSGHWHKNHIVKSEEHQVTNFITSAVGLQLGGDKSGYRLVKVFDDDIEQNYFDFDHMPTRVDLGRRLTRGEEKKKHCCSHTHGPHDSTITTTTTTSSITTTSSTTTATSATENISNTGTGTRSNEIVF